MEATKENKATQKAEQTDNSPAILTFDFLELVHLLLKKAKIIIAVGLLVGIISAVWGMMTIPYTYQATEKLYVSGGSNSIVDLSDLQLGSTLSSDYRQVFRNTEIHEQIRQKLHLEYTNEQLDAMLRVTNPTGRIIQIQVRSTQSEYEALRMVEEYCEAARLFIEERMGGRIPSVFEKATLLETQGRGLAGRVIISCIIGSLAVILIIAGKYILDDRITSKKLLEYASGISLLGVLPATEEPENKKNAKKKSKGK
ncbi:MAG: hypothetical protein IJ662_03220 [Clostridia bacterium]|nr:hypothetical protein [Clostridia bacterium]